MLRRLDLYCYRNLDHLQVEFMDGLNALVGTNGQGKTNILEAVYYLSLLRSFRTSQVNDLKQWKSAGFTLRGLCERPELPDTELTVIYGAERRLLVDGNPVYRTSEFINRFVCVTFIPQDLELIRGSEAQRRRFLDIALSQLSPRYLKNLQGYQEALKSRNALLKDRDRYNRQVVTAYDTVLVQKGVQVEVERRSFVERLNAVLSEQSSALIEDGRPLSVRYLSGLGSLLQVNDDAPEALEAHFRDSLERNYERDCREGFTHCGPHRAELTCLLNGASLLHFGSEGECRMASLAMKFACLAVMRQELPAADVTLIVDDVIGELDARRQANVFAQLEGKGQILLAGTFLPDCLRGKAAVQTVQGGRIISRSTP